MFFKNKVHCIIILSKFYCIKRHILYTFNEMRALNSFWCPYITICFIGHVAMSCFLIVRFFQKADKLEFVDAFTLIMFAVTFGCILIFICYMCSCIVYNNVLLFKEFVKFNYLVSKVTNQHAVDLLLVNLTLIFLFINNFFQLNKIVSNHRGVRNGIRLANNLLIDSKIVELVSKTILFTKI